MFTRPPDLHDDQLAGALRDGWGLVVASMEYRPVGFGSHHWEMLDDEGVRWFVTVDDDPPIERLHGALATAIALHQYGLGFVVAPRPALDGLALRRLGRFALAVYPFVDGESFTWQDPPPVYYDAIRDMLVALHAAPPACRRHALADDLVIPGRHALVDARVPDSGPYARPTAALLVEHEQTLRDALARYDALVATAVEQPVRVLTHGEPHPGNTMRTEGGWNLIDFDTVLVGPPERDLWDLEQLWHAYEDATNTRLRPSLLELYRLRWYLGDAAAYAMRFRAPHNGCDDDVKSWNGLRNTVPRLSGL